MIAVIGDIIIDEYIFGESSRLSPEAPVPVVNHLNTVIRPGGANNVYHNIRALTDHVRMVTDCNNPPRKVRVFSRGHYITRIDYEGEHEWTTHHDYQHADVVVVSDYNKGAIQHLSHFPSLPAKVIVDPKKSFDHYKGAWCIKPNRHEMEDNYGKWNSMHQLYELMDKAMHDHDFSHIIVTLGADGVAYKRKDSYSYHEPTQAAEVFDVTGAGDTFIATLAYAIDSGYGMIGALKLANKAAGVAVSHTGTYIIQKSDIL